MLSHADLADAKAIWEERVGPGYTLEVQIVGEHGAEIDQDRPLGVKVTATLSLRIIVSAHDKPLFDERIPYDREALLASVRALSGHLLAR